MTGPGSARITVLMPVHRPDPRHLRLAIRSVLQQTVDDWQMVLVDDASDDSVVSGILRAAAEDPRVDLVELTSNVGISGASNSGLAGVRAPWVALLDHDDLLEPDALACVLEHAARHPLAEVLYSDRDAVDDRGVPTEVFRKPDWSPVRLLGNMYIAHLTVVSTTALRAVGGFRPEFDGAQDHDAVLRIVERGAPVIHIPRVLYHWRQTASSTARDPAAKPYATVRGEQAVASHLERTGQAGVVRPSAHPGFYQLELRPAPAVASIIIPTRGSRRSVGGRDRVLALEAVRSICAHPRGTDVEFVIVHDSDADPSYLADIERVADGPVTVVGYDPPFNFSAKVNLGAQRAAGDVLVFLNDDVEVVTERWLDQLVALAQRDGVGAVGAKLVFEDGTIQHAGHVYSHGRAHHVAFRQPDGPGPFAANILDREVAGVTAACMVQRREVWQRVGGFDETLPNNFNDVDYCLRIRARGLRVVQANSVVLRHFESQTRRAKVAAWEAERIQARWAEQLEGEDPYTHEAGRGRNPLAGRPLGEWWRISRDVVVDEGPRAFAAKARRRLRGASG